MTKTRKIVLGGVLGMLLTSFISSTYFYRFVRKVIRKIDSGLQVWDFKY